MTDPITPYGSEPGDLSFDELRRQLTDGAYDNGSNADDVDVVALRLLAALEVAQAALGHADYEPCVGPAGWRPQVRKPVVPNPCSVCGIPIMGGTVTGTGDGLMRDGGSFAHESCYLRERLTATEQARDAATAELEFAHRVCDRDGVSRARAGGPFSLAERVEAVCDRADAWAEYDERRKQRLAALERELGELRAEKDTIADISALEAEFEAFSNRQHEAATKLESRRAALERENGRLREALIAMSWGEDGRCWCNDGPRSGLDGHPQPACRMAHDALAARPAEET